MKLLPITAACALLAGLSLVAGCDNKGGDTAPAGGGATSSAGSTQPPATDSAGSTGGTGGSAGAAAKEVTTKSGLKYTDEKVGTGTEAKPGNLAVVHYSGYLTDGTKFDSSVDKGVPFAFTIGAGEVIKGWDEGVAGMKVGGKRKLVIPPDLGYGSQDKGTIPPNSTLLFDVELMDLRDALGNPVGGPPGPGKGK